MRLVWLPALLLFAALPAFGVTSNVTAKLGAISGNSRYQIGEKSPVSELVFPLNTLLFQAEGGISWENVVFFRVGLGKNISSYSGKMTDSDWDSSGNLETYSESDSDLNLFTADAHFLVNCIETPVNGLRVGLGYYYQNFDFTISNTRQTYPSSNKPPEYIPDKTLLYSIVYHIPVFEIVGYSHWQAIRSSLAIGYSPFVTSQDSDNHILRSRVGDGNQRGQVWIIDSQLHYQATPQLSFSIDAHYLKTVGFGRQVQTEYGSSPRTLGIIDQTVASDQYSVLFGLRHMF